MTRKHYVKIAEDEWTDGANTFWQAKQNIDRWELEKKA